MINYISAYTLDPHVSAEEHDRWLYDVHTPDLMRNPYLERVVYNTAREVVHGDKTFFAIMELHYRDMATYERAQAWRNTHPIPPERGPTNRVRYELQVLTDVTEVEYRRASNTLKRGYPTTKVILGYTLEKGWTPEAYDAWLYDIHTPDLMRNPYLRRISYNTVLKTFLGAKQYYRISELVYEDLEAWRSGQAWREQHPNPEPRRPEGKTAFDWSFLCDVVEVEYRRSVSSA